MNIWVFFDIDGVLTDGYIYINSEGQETKRYRLTEIDALNDIKRHGYRIAAITGEDTPIVDCFKRIVKWDYFESGCKDKLSSLKRIAENNGLIPKDICYIGDGKYDIEAVRYAGLGVCPQNAIQDVKEVADVILEGYGGQTCVYELFKLLTDGDN